MSRVARLPSEAEGLAWEAEDDDMAEGDLGYGLRRRPGGICEMQVSHLFKSRKRSGGKNFSPPLFSRNGDERSGAVFQYSRQKSFQDPYLEGPQIPYHKRQSLTGKNAYCLHPLFSLMSAISAATLPVHEDGSPSWALEIYLYSFLEIDW